MQGITRGLRIQVDPEIIIIIFFVMSQYQEKLVLNCSILYGKSKFRFKASFPFKVRNGYIFFIKIDGSTRHKEQGTRNKNYEKKFYPIHSAKIYGTRHKGEDTRHKNQGTRIKVQESRYKKQGTISK